MSAFINRNNKEYLIHIIAIKRLIKQKGMDQDIKKEAFEVPVQVRRELQPLLKASDDKTEIKKEEHKKELLDFKKVLKTKRNFAIVEAHLSSVMRKCNGTRLCMKCSPRTPG
jgi:hypothetical protein